MCWIIIQIRGGKEEEVNIMKGLILTYGISSIDHASVFLKFGCDVY